MALKSTSSQKGFVAIGLIVILLLVYFFLFSLARGGWGYMGYRGYGYGPSWWYMGGPSYHYGDDIRNGGIRGRSHRGGGFRGGK